MTAHAVVEEGRVNVLVEVFAGRTPEDGLGAATRVPLEVVIPLLQQEGHPPDLVFNEDQLEPGEALEDPGEDEVVERVHGLGHLLIYAIEADVSGDIARRGIADGLGVVAVAAEDVQVDGHIHFLGRRP